MHSMVRLLINIRLWEISVAEIDEILLTFTRNFNSPVRRRWDKFRIIDNGSCFILHWK